MHHFRRIVLVLVAALVSASAASAEPAPPTVTLLSPASGASVPLDGKHNPTFSWQVDFAQPQTGTTQIQLTVSTDPTFQSSRYTELHLCNTSNPACFTSTTPQGTYWIIAATGTPGRQTKPITLYWRVTVKWESGQTPATSATSAISGTPAATDKTPPRVAVKATTAKRGSRARVRFQLADDSGTVTAKARLVYRNRTLFTTSRVFPNVTWGTPYVFWFDVPKRTAPGRYSACVRATDAHGNSAQSCAPIVIH